MQLNFTKAINAKIESLGVQEIDVYDLELKDNHNFFANGILVHNTDSIYINVDPLVRAVFADKMDATIEDKVTFLDKLGKTKFQEQINQSIDYIFSIGNCYDKVMDMKREAIASKAIWSAKKRYAMMVHNSEGVDYRPYKLKIMGMDLIKSSTPMMVRKHLKEALITIFEKDQEALYKYVSDFHKKFKTVPIEDISFPRSVSDLDKYSDSKTIYKKNTGTGTPIAVRGALIFNHMNRGNKNVVPIKSSDKVKFIYLKLPNPTKENVIAFPSSDRFPNWMGLEKYVDYETQWEKVFIAPLKGICDKIGWSPERVATLEEFF